MGTTEDWHIALYSGYCQDDGNGISFRINCVDIAPQIPDLSYMFFCHVYFVVSWKCQCEFPFGEIIHLLY